MSFGDWQPKRGPEPVPQRVVCSRCGLSWDDHEGSAKDRAAANPILDTCDVDLNDCVALLQVALAKARSAVPRYMMGSQVIGWEPQLAPNGVPVRTSVSQVPYPGGVSS